LQPRAINSRQPRLDRRAGGRLRPQLSRIGLRAGSDRNQFQRMIETQWLDELIALPALDRWLPGTIVAGQELPVPPPDRVAMVEEAKVRIEEELHSITVGELAEDTALSRTGFSRAFRRMEGVSPRAYLQERKIDRAKQLLETGRSLTEIALRLGFCDQSHFTRIFKQLTGETPAAYRRRRTNIQDGEGATG
jgi:AraC-like DNA-binding protein